MSDRGELDNPPALNQPMAPASAQSDRPPSDKKASGRALPWRLRLPTLLLSTGTLLLCALALYFDWFRWVDRFVYDTAITLSPPPLDERLVVVGVDEQTLALLGRWPWDRATQAALIDKIMAAGPKALLVDVVYAGTSEPSQDQALVQAMDSSVVTALPVIFDAVALNQPLIEVLPFGPLTEVTDVLGHVHIELDDDSISRSTYLYQGIGGAHWPHLTLALAQHLGWVEVKTSPCPAPQTFTLQNLRCENVMVPFVGPPGTVQTVSALALLQDQLDPKRLAGKVVLLGLTASGIGDWVTSPVSGESRPMSGVEYNANVLNAIMQNRLITPLSTIVIWVLNLLLVLVPSLLIPRTSPKAMLGVSLGGSLLPLLVSLFFVVVVGRYLPLGAAAVSTLIAYPLWSWRRHEAAWRFLDNEMSRLQEERLRFESPGVSVVADRTLRAEHLAELFNAQLRLSTVEAPDMIFNRQLIRWHGGAGNDYTLTREQAFNEEELALARELLGTSESKQALPEPIPGESLAAKIRLLEQQADEIRLGRDIGLQGLERMSSGVCVVSAAGEALFANTAFRGFLEIDGTDINRPEAKLVSTPALDWLADITPPIGQSWMDIWRRVVFTGDTVGFETPLSAERQGYIYSAPLSGNARGLWLVTITDTTEVRVAQRRREEALAFLSHDLRSPIVSVIALARQGGGEEVFAAIENYAQKSLAVSEQFLQLSRLEAQTRFETYELDLLAVLDNALDQVYTEARQRNVQVDSTSLVAFDDGIWISGNGELLERALANLLGNALKYSDSNTVVTVTAGLSASDVWIEVKDQGLGISEEDLPRIFEPYFRANSAEHAQRRGSGLGLRFVKTVVERHAGRMTVASELGAGSTFRLELPLLEDSGNLEG